MRKPGFTLIEMAVVLGLIAIVAALGMATLSALKSRTSMTEAASTLATDLTAARERALAEQVRVVAVFWHSSDATNPPPDRYLVFVDRVGSNDIGTMTPESLLASVAKADLVADRTLAWPIGLGPAAGSVFEFGAPSSSDRTVLPAPYQSVIAGGPCTFGASTFNAPYQMRGGLAFLPDGGTIFYGGLSTGAVGIQDAATPGVRSVVAVVGATGAVKVFRP